MCIRLPAAVRRLSAMAVLLAVLAPVMDGRPNVDAEPPTSSNRGDNHSSHPLATLACFDSICGLVDHLKAAGNYAEAESLAAQALVRCESIPECAREQLTGWLLATANLRVELGRLDAAESLFQQVEARTAAMGDSGASSALEVVRGRWWLARERRAIPEMERRALFATDLSARLFGPTDARYGEDLWRLAEVRILQNRVAEAESLLSGARDLIARERGETDEWLGYVIHDQALLASRGGRHEEALRLYQQDLAIVEARKGPEHPDVAGTLLGLAVTYRNFGEYAEAESLCLRALAIRERVFGPLNPQVAVVLNNLGVTLSAQGDYAAAGEAYRRTLDIYLARRGEQDEDVGLAMMNYSTVLTSLGRYAESLRYARRSVEILESVCGRDHFRTAQALNTYARTLRQRGRLVEAEHLYRRSLDIVTGLYGSPHPDAALYRREIGVTLAEQGRLDEACRHVEQAIAEETEIFGLSGLRVARHQRYLGGLRLRQGRTAEGLELLRTSLETLAREHGSDHPALLPCHHGLARAYLSRNEIEAAQLHASRTLDIVRQTTSASTLAQVDALLLNADVAAEQDQWDRAIRLSIAATNAAIAVWGDIYQVSSEQEALEYARLPRRAAERLLSCAHHAGALPESLRLRVCGAILTIHGQVLDRLAKRHLHLARVADDPEVQRWQAAFWSASQRLSNLMVRGGEGPPERFRRELDRARRAKEKAEEALAEAGSLPETGLIGDQDRSTIAPEHLARVMESGTRLIQYVRFPVRRPAGTALRGDQAPGSQAFPPAELYGAFCIRADRSRGADVAYVELGSAERLDALVAAYRRAIEDVADCRRPTAREEAAYRRVARELHALLWEPVVKSSIRLGEPAASSMDSLILVIPVAQLHGINFGTLLSAAGELVIERWRVHLLSSARDLLRDPPAAGLRGVGLLAVGDPAGAPISRSEPERASAALCPEMSWAPAPLMEAGLEARNVADRFARSCQEPVTLLIGADANEPAVRSELRGRRMVHLATHGFSCPPADTTTATWDVASTSPLLLSGLILARGGGDEDGFLTAQEVIGADLRGTDWVVLSACGSGLGQLLPGEGLAGLRRAFEMAGCRTVVMTLWRIDDRATRVLMESIYERRLGGAQTVDAIRLAQLELLSKQRRDYGRLHPGVWGGVVAEGDWR